MTPERLQQLKDILLTTGAEFVTLTFKDGTTEKVTRNDGGLAPGNQDDDIHEVYNVFRNITGSIDPSSLRLRGNYVLTESELKSSPFFFKPQKIAELLRRRTESVNRFIDEYVPRFSFMGKRYVDIRLYITARYFYLLRTSITRTEVEDRLLNLVRAVKNENVYLPLNTYTKDFVPYSTNPFLLSVADLARFIREPQKNVKQILKIYSIPCEPGHLNPILYDVRRIITTIRTHSRFMGEYSNLPYIRRMEEHLTSLERFVHNAEALDKFAHNEEVEKKK